MDNADSSVSFPKSVQCDLTKISRDVIALFCSVTPTNIGQVSKSGTILNLLGL